MRSRVQRLGRYEVGPRLGKGGFGEVFAGAMVGDLGFRRPVAIKVLPEPNAAELALAQRLQHPHIIEVLDVFVEDGLVYLVMELADAGSVGALLRRGPLSVEAAAHVADGVLAALAAAHAAGVVAHRDVTPHNVLIFSDGRVKLADFGIAKAKGVDGPTTRTGLVKGKLPYLAPEQVRQEGVDARTDLWSLGVMLYELVSGHRPFGRRSGSEAEALAAIARAHAPNLGKLGLPPWFEGFLAGLLVPDREGRWVSAEAARAVLEQGRAAWATGQGALVAALSHRNRAPEATQNVRPPRMCSGPAVEAAPPRPRPTASGSLRVLRPRRRRVTWGLWVGAALGLGLAAAMGLLAGRTWPETSAASSAVAAPVRARPVKVGVERRIGPLEPAPVAAPKPKPKAAPERAPKGRERALRPEFFEPGGTLEVK